MTMILTVAIVLGTALAVAAVAYTRRSRQKREPLQLGVGRRFRF
jgi:hypothetical protein